MLYYTLGIQKVTHPPSPGIVCIGSETELILCLYKQNGSTTEGIFFYYKDSGPKMSLKECRDLMHNEVKIEEDQSHL